LNIDELGRSKDFEQFALKGNIAPAALFCEEFSPNAPIMDKEAIEE